MEEKSLVTLFQSVNRGTVNLIDSLSVLTALTDLNRSKSEAELLSRVMRILLENQDIEHCAMFINHQGSLLLQATAAWGDSDIITREREPSWLKYDVKDDHETIVEALESRQILIKQCQQLPDFFVNFHDYSLDEMDIVGHRSRNSSMLCVPLIDNEKVHGVLCLHHSKSDYFKSSHEQFFSLFAKCFVQVLLNYRYAHDLQKQVAERTEQLEEALRVARKFQKDLKENVFIDELTGLPNRRFFTVESHAALARAIRYKHPFSCCIMEVKHQIDSLGEDSWGLQDQRTQALADILKMHIREADILAHLRGDQFILSMPENDIQNAKQFAERILHVLLDAQENVELFLSMRLSIGLSTLPQDLGLSSEATLSHLMKCADHAMRAAKSLGRRICHYDDIQNMDIDLTLIS
jgi:diguanylate cyclase (GGDEF)-like protein